MAIPGYRILRKIRQGGMSTVYLAVQQSVEREVAIKVMSPSLNSDPGFSSRFHREAKIVGQLSHPNIISIYDVGSHRQYNYIAMDYLPGAPLQDRLKQGVSHQQALSIVKDIAAAIDYAGKQGYVHRDIKPDNILFRENGSAVLCDFGIAKAIKGNIKMTNIGAVLGTPHYMSPEQAQGKEIDGRTDIYSLGIVLYEMLTGHVPFDGDDPVAVAVKHISSAVPKLPAELKIFQPIIEKMLAKKTSARFHLGSEIIDAITQLESVIELSSSQSIVRSKSTSVQVGNLLTALFSTLFTTSNHFFKRLLLTNIQFSKEPTQLSDRQRKELDAFILNEDSADLTDDISNAPIIQDTIEQPAIRSNWRWTYWPIGIISMLLLGFIYLDNNHKQQLRNLYVDISAPKITIQPQGDISTPIDVKHPAITKHENLNDSMSTGIEENPPGTEEIPPAEYALLVTSQPDTSTIRILNIKPVYRQGIRLPSGSYHLEVSAVDYVTKNFWLYIDDSDIEHHITLESTRRLLPQGSIVSDDIAGISGEKKGPSMVIVPQLDSLHFAISQHEITFHHYDQFAQLTSRAMPNDFGWGRDDRPVINVSYEDARAYAMWLSKQTDKTYRLLTQSEWEHAARAGTTTTHWWGEQSATRKANCRRGCKSEFSQIFGSKTAPAGYYPPSPYQLYDTAGNVAEWLDACQQWNGDDRKQCKSTLLAGGSHQDKLKNIAPTFTEVTSTSTTSKHVGFRLLLEL
ncbi:MAG: bifunctional serine/threonine-protein kinase/formylglycine-generating enzyme family protein [Oceanicoccus sp.]